MDSNHLRERIREERTFADAVEAFSLLVLQPDLTWRDLLDGLEHSGLIAETAATRLHSALNFPCPTAGCVIDRGSWERTLNKMHVSPDSLVSGTVQGI